MNLRSRHFLVLLLLFWALALGGQSRVNPTVKVLPRPAVPVPAECDESLAPAAEPRLQTAEVQPVERDSSVDLLPPPSRDLRAQLSDAQDAIERSDRESFRAAVAAVKTTLATFPPGGERNAANDALAVYNDIDRLWDYQYSSPTGSFFDETVQGGSLLAAVRKYPGYDDFIQRQVVTDASGVRLYPSRESRDFLTRIASDRLARVGVTTTRPRTTSSTPAPVDRRTTPAVTTPGTTERPRVATTTPRRETPRSTASRSSSGSTTRSSTPRRSTSVARVTPAPSQKPVSEGQPTETPATRVTTPAPSQTAARTSPAPSRTTPPATTAARPSGAPPVVVPPAAAQRPEPTETAAEATDTSTTSEETTTSVVSTDTASTSPEGAFSPAPTVTDTGAASTTTRTTSKTRSVILPIILILIGVGVLIVLFRASS